MSNGDQASTGKAEPPKGYPKPMNLPTAGKKNVNDLFKMMQTAH